MQPLGSLMQNTSAAVSAANTLSDLKRPMEAHGSPVPITAPFSGVLQEAMGNLESLEQQASSAVDGLVTGKGVDVHQAMIATQKSDLAFETALAIRGKMVSAYQTMMGIQF